MMLHIFRKGKQGAADSQRALCIRTLGMWLGKDSRENVEANATRFFRECQSLQTEGIMFDDSLQTFLGRTEAWSQLSEEAKLKEEKAAPDTKRFFPVQVKFWFPADMAAQCAVIGHGCAGHRFCAHCMTHENERHLPYALVTTTELTSLQAMAHQYDLHARTLYAINACVDHQGVQVLTQSGLGESTVLDAEARAAQAQAPEREPDRDVSRRPQKRPKTAPRPKFGPDVEVLKGLVGWRDPVKHSRQCMCKECVIPVGTCVRVIPRVPFSRPSEYLKLHFPDLTADRCPFCALHCKMRVAETLFQQICKAAETSKHESKLVTSMNEALKKEGISKKYQKPKNSKTYEKVSFEGHQVMALLKKGEDGKMGIQRVLEAMWPGSADSQDNDVRKAYGIAFVPRTIEVWRQFAVVEKLMSERYFNVLEQDIVNGEDGFSRFGKECREFIFRFQAMSTEDYSKAYYLHTLLHHAGDFMRALQSEGFTLGMMSNSGVERRHEYGRRASRKALASNGWRKKNPEYDQKPNLLIYLTMKEVLMWDYGEDLISYIIARRIRDGHVTVPAGHRIDFSSIKSRKALLSEDEARMEYDAQPDDPPPHFETCNKRFWTQTGRKMAYALIGVKPDEDTEDAEATSDNQGPGGDSDIFNPDHYPKLFSHVPVPFSDDDESEAGSEEDTEEDTKEDTEEETQLESHGGITINSFEFPESDSELDEDFSQEDEEDESLEYMAATNDGLSMKARARKQPAAAQLDRAARRPPPPQMTAIGAQEAVVSGTDGLTVVAQERPAQAVTVPAQVDSGCPASSGAVPAFFTFMGAADTADGDGSRRPIRPGRFLGWPEVSESARGSYGQAVLARRPERGGGQ